jgi:hypothetical protein
MRSEEDIKAGLADANKLACECFIELTDALTRQDWQTVFEKSSTINLIAISTMAINDSCFDK